MKYEILNINYQQIEIDVAVYRIKRDGIHVTSIRMTDIRRVADTTALYEGLVIRPIYSGLVRLTVYSVVENRSHS